MYWWDGSWRAELLKFFLRRSNGIPQAGDLDIDVSVIGFGTEHIPPQKDTMAEISAVSIEAGVNYIDVL